MHFATFSCDNDLFIDTTPSALSLADIKERFEKPFVDGETLTVCLRDQKGELTHWFSNRRIVGNFEKQAWGGRRNDDAIYVEDVDFDATEAVLRCDLAEIHLIDDCSDTTDEIGRDHVDWVGPCSVTLENSICRFFGVEQVTQVTQKHLELAREAYNFMLEQEVTIELAIKVRVRKSPGQSWEQVLEKLKCGVRSNVQGSVVIATEVAAYPSNDLRSFKVDVGYGELGTGENHALGSWTGLAMNEEDAKRVAHSQLWEQGLDTASCAPRYTVIALAD